VLYELLTGQRPGGPDAAIDAVRDAPLTAPSAAVRRQIATVQAGPGTSAALAASRQTSPARLVRRLSGDVDCVVLKALQPEPERRYGSAGQLADDLQRLLDGRPVLAQPDTRGYRLRRFVGRHRVGVAMMSALAIVVVAFAIVAALQARAVAIERDRARLEAARAERVALLVTDLFKLAEPAAGRGSTIAARELLDQGSHRIAVELADDPATQAALSNALARVYGNLGLHDAAIEVLERALGREGAVNGDGTLARAETLQLLGERHASKNDHATAERRFREALALRRQLHAPRTDVAATLEGLGRTLNGANRYAEARAMLEDAVAIRRSEPGASPAELMSGLHELGLLVHFAGDTARAERLFRESVAVGQRIPGPSRAKIISLRQHAQLAAQFDHAPARAEALLREALAMARAMHPGDHEDTATCLAALSENLKGLRKLPEAETSAREAATMLRRLYGPGHVETLSARLDLARVLNAANKFGEAEPILRDSLGDARSFLGDGHPTTIVTARGLATVIEQQGRFAEALAVRRDELARTTKALGAGDVFVATGLTGLGQHGLMSGRLTLAETYFAKALEAREKLHPAGHWRIDDARGMVGLARLRAGRYGAAEADLLAAYEGLRAHRGPDADETQAARTNLVDLYERWNRPDRARQYRSEPR
jgi:tetratricopeptide (TPR) repeat protein